MPDFWQRSVRQFRTWTGLLVVYLAAFLAGSLIIDGLTTTDASFLLWWRAFFFAMVYLPFGGVSVYAMSVAWSVYVDGDPIPDNLFFSSGAPPTASSRFSEASGTSFRRAGAVVDHVRIWLYALAGPVLVGLTLGDALATARRLARTLLG